MLVFAARLDAVMQLLETELAHRRGQWLLESLVLRLRQDEWVVRFDGRRLDLPEATARPAA